MTEQINKEITDKIRRYSHNESLQLERYPNASKGSPIIPPTPQPTISSPTFPHQCFGGRCDYSYTKLEATRRLITLFLSAFYKGKIVREETDVVFDKKFGYRFVLSLCSCSSRSRVSSVSPSSSRESSAPISRVLSFYSFLPPLCRLSPFQTRSKSRLIRIFTRSPSASFPVKAQVIVLLPYL